MCFQQGGSIAEDMKRVWWVWREGRARCEGGGRVEVGQVCGHEDLVGRDKVEKGVEV